MHVLWETNAVNKRLPLCKVSDHMTCITGLVYNIGNWSYEPGGLLCQGSLEPHISFLLHKSCKYLQVIMYSVTNQNPAFKYVMYLLLDSLEKFP